MNQLIVSYSHTGNNELLAKIVKDKLNCEILYLKEKRKRKTISILLDFIFNRKAKLLEYDSLDQYDTFILIAPIWGGKLATPMRTFIMNEKNRLNKYFLITICNGIEGQKEKITSELTSILQCEPIIVTELWINHLLPEDKRNKVKYTFNYRVDDNEINQFNTEIDQFVDMINDMRYKD